MKPKMVEAGQPIKVGELSLTVLKELESGRNKRVYKVKDQRGVLYVYKHMKKRDVKKEVERTVLLVRFTLPHAKVVSSGSDYLLREWIEGIRGDAWLKSWESFGAPMEAEAVASLSAMLDKASRAGVYVGNLEPEDLVFDGEHWSILNCGSVRELPPKEVATRYFWKMFERWGEHVDRHRSLWRGGREAGTSLGNLFSIFSPLGRDYAEPVKSATEALSLNTYAKAPARPAESGMPPEVDSAPSSGELDSPPSSGNVVDDSPSSGSLPPDNGLDDNAPDVLGPTSVVPGDSTNEVR